MNKKYEEFVCSKTFEELLEGYKKSIMIIKKIDKQGYLIVKECIATCSKYFYEYIEECKKGFESLESKEDIMNFYNTKKLYINVDDCAIDMKGNAYQTFSKAIDKFLGPVRDEIKIMPVFDELTDQKYRFYTRKINKITEDDTPKEWIYYLYKNENDKLCVRIRDMDHPFKSKVKKVRK